MSKKNTKKKSARQANTKTATTIFHCEHRHAPSRCFANDKEKKQIWVQAVKNAEDYQVRVRDFLISPLEHRIFLVLESPTVDAVEKAFGSVKQLGDMVITPVLEGSFLDN